MRRIYGLLATSLLLTSQTQAAASTDNQLPAAHNFPTVAEHNWIYAQQAQLQASHSSSSPSDNRLQAVIVGQDEADMYSSQLVQLSTGPSWDGLVEEACGSSSNAVSVCDVQLTEMSGQHEKSDTIEQTVVESPSHDRTLAPDQKWKVALDLARAACPSGTLFVGDFEVRAQYGEDTDRRLGYTDVSTREIVIDVRPAQRAVDVAITYLHEANHEQDVVGRIDRARWIRTLGLAEDVEWYIPGGQIMSPAESLAVLTSVALIGKPTFEDSLQNSGYAPSPAVVELVAHATPQQLQTVRALSGCV